MVDKDDKQEVELKRKVVEEGEEEEEEGRKGLNENEMEREEEGRLMILSRIEEVRRMRWVLIPLSVFVG